MKFSEWYLKLVTLFIYTFYLWSMLFEMIVYSNESFHILPVTLTASERGARRWNRGTSGAGKSRSRNRNRRVPVPARNAPSAAAAASSRRTGRARGRNWRSRRGDSNSRRLLSARHRNLQNYDSDGSQKFYWHLQENSKGKENRHGQGSRRIYQ